MQETVNKLNTLPVPLKKRARRENRSVGSVGDIERHLVEILETVRSCDGAPQSLSALADELHALSSNVRTLVTFINRDISSEKRWEKLVRPGFGVIRLALEGKPLKEVAARVGLSLGGTKTAGSRVLQECCVRGDEIKKLYGVDVRSIYIETWFKRLSQLSRTKKEALLKVLEMLEAEHILPEVDGEEVPEPKEAAPTPSPEDIRKALAGLGSRSIDELGLSARPYNRLKENDIETIRELCLWSPQDLMELKDFGAKCLEEISFALARIGLRIFGPHSAGN